MNTFSIWTRDGMNGWNKAGAMYADRKAAANIAASCHGKVVFHGGGFHGVCTDVAVFPSTMGRVEVESKLALRA